MDKFVVNFFYLSKIPSYLVQRIIISFHCSTKLWLQQKYKGITNRIMTLVVVGPCKVKKKKVFYYLHSYYFQILVSIIRLLAYMCCHLYRNNYKNAIKCFSKHDQNEIEHRLIGSIQISKLYLLIWLNFLFSYYFTSSLKDAFVK